MISTKMVEGLPASTSSSSKIIYILLISQPRELISKQNSLNEKSLHDMELNGHSRCEAKTYFLLQTIIWQEEWSWWHEWKFNKRTSEKKRRKKKGMKRRLSY